MAASRSVGVSLVGVFNVLAGGAMVWGGAEQAAVFWPEAPLNVGIGATGALVGVLLVLSALALRTRRGSARALTFAAAGAAVLVHSAGMLAGIIGIPPGLLIGVVYPTIVMVWLARGGGSRRPEPGVAGAARSDRDPRAPGRLRSSLA